MTLSFLLTSLIVVVSPGTGVLYTLAVALTSGARASVAAAFGCTLGIVPHMLAAMLGLAAVLHTSAVAFAALKWCGVDGLAGAARNRGARDRGAAGGGAFEPARGHHRLPDQTFSIQNCRSSFSPSCRNSSRSIRPTRWDGCWN